ncbi:VOC family protein [Sphingomonas sp. S2M10]|uniref:VOC family protein n=1 Tax=Sphingomonas sp. S2M10 TaxID=2705010 RepID=UPI001FFD6ED9|nr:VOC family protein [Sphingomonas sp. S2M10]
MAISLCASEPIIKVQQTAQIRSNSNRRLDAMTTQRIQGIDHVGVVVQDLAASVDWYAEKLGFRVLHPFAFPGAVAAFVGREGLRLELLQVEGAAPPAPERFDRRTNLRLGGINHLAIGVANMAAMIADLEAKGVEIVSPPVEVPGSGGELYAFIRDGEGMLIELYQRAG